MKKFFCLVVLIFVSISCSKSDENETELNAIDPTKLVKVIFFPGALNERHWNFYDNGLLKEITKPDGTIIQNFIYDKDNKLTNSKVFNPNGSYQLFTFTYDANNFVTSPNIYYDSSIDLYIIGDVNSNHSVYKLNSDKLVTYSATVNVEYNDGVGYSEDQNKAHITYMNKNITSSSSDSGQNCNTYDHDYKINPLRNATLPICRAFSTMGTYYGYYNEWVDAIYNSKNNVISKNPCSEGYPESNVYQYEYNSNNLPVKNTLSWYYGKVLEATTVYVLYYYQGDVIPN